MTKGSMQRQYSSVQLVLKEGKKHQFNNKISVKYKYQLYQSYQVGDIFALLLKFLWKTKYSEFDNHFHLKK